LDVHRRVMATALGVLASTGALRTHISQLFSFFLVHLLEIYTCLSNTRIYSTLGGTPFHSRHQRDMGNETRMKSGQKDHTTPAINFSQPTGPQMGPGHLNKVGTCYSITTILTVHTYSITASALETQSANPTGWLYLRLTCHGSRHNLLYGGKVHFLAGQSAALQCRNCMILNCRTF
jgi:hypothetical protein